MIIYIVYIILAVALSNSLITALLLRQITSDRNQQARERQDLYNRIMAGGLADYKAATAERKGPTAPPAHRRAVEQWKKPSEERL